MNIIVTGSKGYLSMKIASKLSEPVENNVMQVSIREDDYLYLLPGDIDCIVHIAGVSPKNVQNESDYYSVNFEKTKQLFDIARDRCVKHFIYVSTMAVYGNILADKSGRPVSESSPCNPCSAYGKSKLAAESYIKGNADGSIKWTILRVPSLYDQKETDYFLGLEKWIRKLPAIPLFSKETYRSILHINNLCDLISDTVMSNTYLNEIVLPQDRKAVSVTCLQRKINKELKINKRESKMLGIIISCASLIYPQICNISGSAYYDPHSSVCLGTYSIDDITLGETNE